MNPVISFYYKSGSNIHFVAEVAREVTRTLNTSSRGFSGVCIFTLVVHDLHWFIKSLLVLVVIN